MDRPSPTKTALHQVLIDTIGVAAFDALFERARAISFEAGEVIFSTGEPGSGVILIDDGRVEISTMSFSGRKSVLAHMGPGELLGEIAALDGGNRSADAVAATKVTGRFLAQGNMLDFIATRPDLAKAVIFELCAKTRNASEMFVTQTTPEADIRLARALLRLFEAWGAPDPDGSSVALTERFSQQDLGEFCSLARENVNRQIKAWTAMGIIGMRGRQMILLDREGLRAIADDGGLRR